MSYQQAAKLGFTDNWLGRRSCKFRGTRRRSGKEREAGWEGADQRPAHLTEQRGLKPTRKKRLLLEFISKAQSAQPKLLWLL